MLWENLEKRNAGGEKKKKEIEYFPHHEKKG